MADSGRRTSSGTQFGQILASEVVPRKKTELKSKAEMETEMERRESERGRKAVNDVMKGEMMTDGGR